MKDRREILKGMAIASTWATPLVSSVMLPAHAQTSVITQPTGQFLLTFTASNFSVFFGGDNPAPVPVVSGEIIYQTAEITNNISIPIDSLISIDLTINGFSYDVANIVTNQTGLPIVRIGESTSESSVTPGIDDFSLNVVQPHKEFLSLVYSTSGINTVWNTGMGSTTVTPILA